MHGAGRVNLYFLDYKDYIILSTVPLFTQQIEKLCKNSFFEMLLWCRD